MTEARTCQRCARPFASRKGSNLYCEPCGPVASKATRVAYVSEHTEARRLYGIAYRANRTRALPVGRLLRCWCGNLFMPRNARHKHCTNECARRAWRNRARDTRPIVVAPAPTLPPVDYDSILREIMETARRARGRIDEEAELAGMRIRQKQERLAGILDGLRNPFAVP